MNSKTISLSFLTILSVILLIGFASAASLSSSVVSVPASVLHNAGSFSVTFNITNTGLDASPIAWTSSVTSGSATITVPTDTTLIANATKTLTATAAFDAHQSGTIAFTITADPSGAGSNEVISFSVPINNTPSLDITSVTDLSRAHNGTIKIENTGNTALNLINLTTSGNLNVSLSTTSISLAAGASVNVNVNSLQNLADLKLGAHSVTITAKDLTSTTATDSLTFNVNGDFCDDGNVNASEVGITDIEDKSDNEWEWKPLDNIEIDIEIENNRGDDESFVVEIALYDSEDNEYVEIDEETTLTQDISLDDDDSDTVTFEFQLPADIEDSTGRYVLYVKAYVDGDEDRYCNSEPATSISSSVDEIRIKKSTNDVILDNIVAPELVTAGETVVISADAFNIGKEDEDKVKVALTNTKLGLNLVSSPAGIDMGESDEVEFSFVVPYTAENGVYVLKLVSYFDYKKSSDNYLKDSDIFEVVMTVVGGIGSVNTTTIKTSTGAAGISASLDSDAKAGEEMQVSVTIKNLGVNKSTFVVGVSDYESWAVLNSISDRILTLNPGESKEITASFNVNGNATGEQTFTIETRAGDKIDTKQVAVEFAGSSWFSRLASSLGSNSLIWIIGAINLVLIVLIIFLAVRIFRK